MKIALTHESQYIEGRWRRFDLIYKHLKAGGNEVKIISFNNDKIDESDDIISVKVSTPIRIIGMAIHFFSFKLISNPFYLIKTCFVLKKIKPDVVISHHYDMGLFLLAFRPIFFKDSILVYDLVDLGVRMSYYKKRKGIIFRLSIWVEETLVPKKVDKVIVVTNFGKDYLNKRGVNSGKIFVLNEIVDGESFRDVVRQKNRLDTFSDPLADKIIVWHGYIRHYQADTLEVIIRAVAIVKKKIPNLKLLVVGPFYKEGYKKKLINLAKTLDAEVDFKGSVPPHQIPTILNSAHIGIQALPNTLFTRFINGVKLSEYICSGLPVLCSNLEGPSELIRGNGFLFDPEDPGDLADKIIKLFESAYGELTENSNKIANEEFSEEAVARKMEMAVKFLQK